jgi:hypothetical protein
MDTTQLKVGDKVWCIHTDSESEGYGDTEPRPPFLGQITNIDPCGCITTFWVSRVGADGVPDTDSNATALCHPSDLFANRDEAAVAYRKAVIEVIDNLDRSMMDWISILKGL